MGILTAIMSGLGIGNEETRNLDALAAIEVPTPATASARPFNP